MIKQHLGLCITAICIGVSTVWPGSAQAEPAQLVQVDAALAAEDGEESIAIVTVSNESDSAIQDILIECHGRGRIIGTRGIRKLEPRQHEFVAIPGIIKSDGSPYVVASFLSEYGKESEAKVLSTAVTQPGPALLPTLIPAFLGLIGVMVGAVALHAFTSVREVRQREYDWGKAQQEKYAAAYMEFRRSWGGMTSSAVLKAAFASLVDKAPVLVDIRSAYEHVINVLVDSSASEDSKVKACHVLESAVDAVITSPWRMKTISGDTSRNLVVFGRFRLMRIDAHS